MAFDPNGFYGHVSANEIFDRDEGPPFRMDVNEIHQARDPRENGYGYQNGDWGDYHQGQQASSSYEYCHEINFEPRNNHSDRTNAYGRRDEIPFRMDREEISPPETFVEICLSTRDVSRLSSQLTYHYKMHCQSSGHNAITVSTGRTGYGAKEVLDIVKVLSGDSRAMLARRE